MRDHGALAGMCGLAPVRFAAHFTPAVEIGWRFAPARWGQGLATEAAGLALDFGFGPLAPPEIVAFTVPANLPSLRVMRRLGMAPAGSFEHPSLPEGHPLRPHLLYRITREAWLSRPG
jgi:RimJ/RimL family protein N-acetyltransferase